MRAKQVLWWMLILSVVGLAVVGQPARSSAASSLSTALPAPAPFPQAVQNGSGIYLTATMGPTCIRTTWYGPECVQPYVGEFVVTALNGAEVTRVMTNYQGQAMIALPPGRYIVGVRTEDVYSWTAPVVVNVLADRYAFITFSIDSRLRGQDASIR